MHKKSVKGEITQKVLKGELAFVYVTHRHDMFYIGEEPNKLYCFRSNPIMFMYITIIVIAMNIVF